MGISADWADVALGALVLAGAGIGWLLRGYRDRKAIQPIVTIRPARLEIINRCSEPLYVTEINGSTSLCIGRRMLQDEYGEETNPVYEQPPVFPMWEVPPHSTEHFPLWINGPIGTAIEVVLNSSLRSIKSKRVTVRELVPTHPAK